jgi:tight adherence protein C
MLIPAIFFLFAFLTIAALIWSAVMLLHDREDPLSARLDELQAFAVSAGARRPVRRRGGFLNSLLYFVSVVPGGEEYIRDTEQQLAYGGLRQRGAVGAYVLFQISFLLILLGTMASFNRGNDFLSAAVAMVATLVLGWLLPKQVLHFFVRRYRGKLQDALPDTVDLLGVVLGTGLALDQAMLRVSEEMEFTYPELASEFSTVVMQVKAGQERSKAFKALVRRTGIEDIKALSAMIIQSERFGTSLSQALKVYADSLRTRRRLRAEAAVAKASIKMLFPIIVFIFPALFVVVLVPGVITVLHSLREGFGPH